MNTEQTIETSIDYMNRLVGRILRTECWKNDCASEEACAACPFQKILTAAGDFTAALRQ